MANQKAGLVSYKVIKQETQEDFFSTCEMEVEMMYCCFCPYCDVDSDRLKIHVFRKHPKEAAIVTNTLNKVDCHTTKTNGIRLFCIRETCTFSSTVCSVYEEHLMSCCPLQQSFSGEEMERLRSTLKFLLDFHSRHNLSATSGFLDYVTCLDTTVMCKDYAKVGSQISANLDLDNSNYSPSVEKNQRDPMVLSTTPSLGSSQTLSLYTSSEVDETDMHANSSLFVRQQEVGNEMIKQEQFTMLQSWTNTNTHALPSVGARVANFDQTSDNHSVSEAILPEMGKARLPNDTSPSKQATKEDKSKETITKNINETQSLLSSSQSGAKYQSRMLYETTKIKMQDSSASKIEKNEESMVDRILPASVIEELLTPRNSENDDNNTSVFNMKRKSSEKSDFAFSDYKIHSKIPRTGTESSDHVHAVGQFINANDNTDIDFLPSPPPPPPPPPMAEEDLKDDDFDVTLLDLPSPPPPIACESNLTLHDGNNSRPLPSLPTSTPPCPSTLDQSVSTFLTTDTYLPPSTDFEMLPSPHTTTTAAAASASSIYCGHNSGYYCKKQCPVFFTPHDMDVIKYSFQELTWTERRVYIANQVRKVPVKRGKGVHSVSMKYFLPNSDGTQVTVCKTFFLESLGFHPRNDRVVMNTLKSVNIGEQPTVHSFMDHRGKAKNSQRQNKDLEKEKRKSSEKLDSRQNKDLKKEKKKSSEKLDSRQNKDLKKEKKKSSEKLYSRQNKDLKKEKTKSSEKLDSAFSDNRINSKLPRTESPNHVHSTKVKVGQLINANDNTDIDFLPSPPPPPPPPMAEEDLNDDDFDVTLLDLPSPPPPIACESNLTSDDGNNSRPLPSPPSSTPPSPPTLDQSFPVSRILTTDTYLTPFTNFETSPSTQMTTPSLNSCGNNSGYSCKKQCPTFFTPHDRDVIKRSFQELTWTERRVYIANCVRKLPVKRGKGVHSASMVYSLPNSDGTPVTVCKTFFLQSLGFHPRNDRVVMNTLKSINVGEEHTVHSFMDHRGKGKNSQKYNKDRIIDHINSYKPEQSYYGGDHTPSDMTILSMFNDFKATHKSDMSYSTFYRTFKSLNITIDATDKHSVKEEA